MVQSIILTYTNYNFRAYRMASKAKLERERLLKRIAEKRAHLESMSDIKIKVPRVSLPSDYNIQSQPLFSLPPELMKPILASGYPGYRKKMAALKKKEAEQAAKMLSYTALRKQREEFRKRLVALIANKDEDMEIGSDEIPSAEEREILRYYYYIRHGVDTIHVAPLDQQVLDRVYTINHTLNYFLNNEFNTSGVSFSPSKIKTMARRFT